MAEMRCVLVFVLSVLATFTSAKIKLGDLITPCSLSDPKLNECAKKSLQDLLPKLSPGIRDLNFPPIDPLKIPFLGLSQTDGPVGLKLNVTDTAHDFVPYITVQKVEIDQAKNHWSVQFHTDRYSIVGTCDAGGRILLLPIVGHGFCNLSTIDMTVRLEIDGMFDKRKGKEYFSPKNVDCKIDFKGGVFLIEGLFGGNKQLGDTMNRFLNENAFDVLKEMKPTLEKVWKDIYGGLIERFVGSVPYNQLFSP